MTTYYISAQNPDAGVTAGNDANDGLTESTPWNDPQYADSQTTDGDIIIALDGTWLSAEIGDFIITNKTLRAKNKHKAIFDCEGNAPTFYAYSTGGNTTTYEGLYIKQWNITTAGGGLQGAGSTPVRVLNLGGTAVITDCKWDTCFGGSGSGSSKNAGWFGGNGSFGGSTPTLDVTLTGCEVINATCDNATNMLYFGVASMSSGSTITVNNCSFYSNSTAGGGAFKHLVSIGGGTITFNNVAIDHQQNTLSIENGNNTATINFDTITDSDPLFVDPDNSILTLQLNSPCRSNAGSVTNNVTDNR